MIRLCVVALVGHLALCAAVTVPMCRFEEGVDPNDPQKLVPTTEATFESQSGGCRTHETIQEALLANNLPSSVCTCQQGTYECVIVEEGNLPSTYYCQQPASLEAREMTDDETEFNSGLSLGADSSIEVLVDDGSN